MIGICSRAKHCNQIVLLYLSYKAGVFFLLKDLRFSLKKFYYDMIFFFLF